MLRLVVVFANALAPHRHLPSNRRPIALPTVAFAIESSASAPLLVHDCSHWRIVRRGESVLRLLVMPVVEKPTPLIGRCIFPEWLVVAILAANHNSRTIRVGRAIVPRDFIQERGSADDALPNVVIGSIVIRRVALRCRLSYRQPRVDKSVCGFCVSFAPTPCIIPCVMCIAPFLHVAKFVNKWKVAVSEPHPLEFRVAINGPFHFFVFVADWRIPVTLIVKNGVVDARIFSRARIGGCNPPRNG